ncbi:MAG: glycoside hydrolase family 15 protein [Candidatus Paceibacterota bacterium]
MTLPSEIQQKVDAHIAVLRTLQVNSGLFLASSAEVTTGYDKSWLRDNFYECLAFEYVGDWETVRKCWKAMLTVLVKHEDKIAWAATHKPHQTWQYIHARYHPETFEEFWEEWGNKQNDAVGAILYKLGDLEEKGHGVIESDAEKRVVQQLVQYVSTIEYWSDPDSGMWEENEELHASSVGAVLAGLKKVSKLPYITVPDELISKGEQALSELLPRESRNKFSDLALLSLLYPYDVVHDDVARHILKDVEYHLTKSRGVIRYKLDRYYNNNIDGYSEEAEWTMGLSWLAIIYAQRGDVQKARAYLSQVELTINPEGKLPELYYSNSGRHNENTPLGWAESMYVCALYELQLLEERQNSN